VCDRDTIGAPSIFKVIRSAASSGRMLLQKSGQFPDGSVRIEVVQIHYVTSQTY
jgi:hypothetical protein